MKKTFENLLFPEQLMSKMISDYVSGKLTSQKFFYRARIEQIDTVGGKLEASPANPPNSVRARIYTNGLDSNLPSEALNIFHPIYPPHMMPPVEVGEHIFVMFEDDKFSNGLWFSTVPSYYNVNYSNPDESYRPATTTAQSFEGTSSQNQTVNIDHEYGGQTISRHETRRQAESFNESQNSVWTNKKVLIIGDSQVAGAYGRYLKLRLESEKSAAAPVTRIGRPGWGIGNWLTGRFTGNMRNTPRSGPNARQVFAEYRPDIIIISMGGNDSSRAESESLVRDINAMWDLATNSAEKVFWVGPPQIFNEDGSAHQNTAARDIVCEKISQVAGQNYIDSRDVTNSILGRDDGVHFHETEREEVQSWVSKVINR